MGRDTAAIRELEKRMDLAEGAISDLQQTDAVNRDDIGENRAAIVALNDDVNANTLRITALEDGDTTPTDPVEPPPDPVEPPPDPIDPPPADDKLAVLLDCAPGAPSEDYLLRYDTYRPKHLAQERDNGSNGWAYTYYDSGLAGIALGELTGASRYTEEGFESVLRYRDSYVLPNDGRILEHWFFPEGLAAHYLLTDDTDSLRAVELIAADAYPWWIDAREDILNTKYRDGRIQGRAILNQVVAYLVTGNEKYAAQSQIGVDRLLQWFDAAGANGRWDSEALPSPDGTQQYCGGMANFQTCHAILEALVRHHQIVEPLPRLPEVLAATLDRVWADWVEPGVETADGGLRYIHPPASWDGTGYWKCDKGGDNTPAKDVSLVCSTAFWYGYRYTGLQRFDEARRTLVAHGIGRTYFSGYKQFNQCFFRPWRHVRV